MYVCVCMCMCLPLKIYLFWKIDLQRKWETEKDSPSTGSFPEMVATVRAGPFWRWEAVVFSWSPTSLQGPKDLYHPPLPSQEGLFGRTIAVNSGFYSLGWRLKGYIAGYFKNVECITLLVRKPEIIDIYQGPLGLLPHHRMRVKKQVPSS